MKTVSDKYPLVVKILSSDDGEPRMNKVWCYVVFKTGQQTFCGGEFFGSGESGCEYKTKFGKITCPECIELIKKIKSVKL